MKPEITTTGSPFITLHFIIDISYSRIYYYLFHFVIDYGFVASRFIKRLVKNQIFGLDVITSVLIKREW